MEFLIIFFSTLIGLVSPVGTIAEEVAENAIRDQFEAVEQLQVRVDNAPSYQILNGRVDRVRIAARGLFPIEDMRIAILEVETDPIDLDGQRIRQGKPRLERPLQAGIRLVLTEADLNRALQSPRVAQRLRELSVQLLEDTEAEDIKRYNLANPRIEFLGNDRLRIQVELREPKVQETLAIVAETTLQVKAGRNLSFINPQVWVNGEAAPEKLVASIAEGASKELDLAKLEKKGLLLRLLQFDISDDAISTATFVRLAPEPR